MGEPAGVDEGTRKAPCSPMRARAFPFPLQSGAGHLLTYEGLFVILSPQAVAAWEEGVGISLVKPGQIPEIET